MNIKIHTIAKEKQRYETVGDWVFDEKGDLAVFVSKMSDSRHEVLVAVHELIEALLCRDRHIFQEEVEIFDIAFEKIREKFPQSIGDMEPGHMISAPYHKEHVFAESIEKLLAKELRVDWTDYSDELNDL